MDKILAKASAEQLAYIDDTALHHAKLLATAGSGKTFSIIAKVWNLIEQGVMSPDQIYVLTFSRQARHDFARKVCRMRATCIDKTNIRTIDSFAKYIIDPDNKVDRSILSYTLREYLRNSSIDTVKESRCLDKIKFLFVDEAQDLNKTQYDVVCLLRDRLGVIVNLIGDPNQNIFQFRGGCDQYLVEFPARVYELCTNYRSYKHLVQFSNPLRKYQKGADVKWVGESARENARVTMFGYETNAQYEGLLLALVNKFRGKIPLHKIAILAPTRGYLGKNGQHRGLCYVANLLHTHGIPAQLLYDDMADKNIEGGRECEGRDGYLTLMTYTSSKGLEWDYVILVDANGYLITRQNYSKARFEDEQYLLYVATTRAKKGMYVFCKKDKANPWFDMLDEKTFHLANAEKFGIQERGQLEFTTKDTRDDLGVHIPFIIYALQEDALYKVNQRFSAHVKESRVFLDTCMTHVDNNRQKFVQKLTRLVFQDAHSRVHGLPLPKLCRIESLLDDACVVFCDNMFVTKWFEDNKDKGWESYSDMLRKNRVPYTVAKFVDEHISQTRDMEHYVLISDKFYNTYILTTRDEIANQYDLYKSSSQVLEDRLETLLYLTSLDYAITTMHYFYAKDYKEMFGQFIVSKNKTHLVEIIDSCKNLPAFNQPNLHVDFLTDTCHLVGTVDYVHNDHVVFLQYSMSPELRLQDTLNYLMHDFVHHKAQNKVCEATVYNLALGTVKTIQGNIDMSLLNDIIPLEY